MTSPLRSLHLHNQTGQARIFATTGGRGQKDKVVVEVTLYHHMVTKGSASLCFTSYAFLPNTNTGQAKCCKLREHLPGVVIFYLAVNILYSLN